MAAIQKKSHPQTLIDCQFIVFSQNYLVEAVRKWCVENGYDGKNQPKLLDIGCYNGRLWTFMKSLFVFTEYYGIDYQQKYIDMAWTKQSDKFQLKQHDITSGLPYDDEMFDIMVSSEVFEHIEDHNYPYIMQELYRILRPGGRMVLGFPMNTKDTEFHTPEKEHKIGHVNFPVHEDFIDLGTNSGFNFIKYDTGYSTSSSWRIPKEIKNHPYYKALKDKLGGPVARCFATLIHDGHTGGGFYHFEKPLDDSDNDK